jgi:hypothetical protein
MHGKENVKIRRNYMRKSRFWAVSGSVGTFQGLYFCRTKPPIKECN